MKMPMNAKRFYGFLRALGLGDEEAWTGPLEEDGELDRVMDRALDEVGGWVGGGSDPITTKGWYQMLRFDPRCLMIAQI